MLFDLRGRGRRRTVQIIYLGLALLMGGGLVLFGVGGATSGGLFDAFSSKSDTPSSTSYTKQIDRLENRVKLTPKDAPAWAQLASLRLAEGASRGGFDGKSDGIKEFQQASTAWESYIALNPPKPDLNVARQMVNLYGQTGLNEPDKAVGVMDIIVDETPSPDANLFKQYAQFAYVAGQIRKGDLAAEKAVALTPKADRAQTKSALAAIKQQVTQAAAQGAAGADTGTTAPPATGATTTTTP
jgi:hypothetical protein